MAYAKVAVSMRRWGRGHLAAIQPSGSHAKGTVVLGGSDIDMLVLLRHDKEGSLGDLYKSAARWLRISGFQVELQNVSIRVVLPDAKVDVVLARKQQPFGFNASLYRRRSDTWTLTNVQKQINTVRNSRRRPEIRLVKVWRNLHCLEFPSFALELATIKALEGALVGLLATNFLKVLVWLAKNIETARLEDPGNTANNVADDMTAEEKRAIALAADVSGRALYWSSVVW